MADGGAVDKHVVDVQGATGDQSCGGDGTGTYADSPTSKTASSR